MRQGAAVRSGSQVARMQRALALPFASQAQPASARELAAPPCRLHLCGAEELVALEALQHEVEAVDVQRHLALWEGVVMSLSRARIKQLPCEGQRSSIGGSQLRQQDLHPGHMSLSNDANAATQLEQPKRLLLPTCASACSCGAAAERWKSLRTGSYCTRGTANASTTCRTGGQNGCIRCNGSCASH